MIENFGEKTAHDLRNGIIALFRDFKDAEAVKFGEIAAEAEAKVISLRQAPHKIDSAKIGFLRSSVERMEGLLAGNSSTFAMEKKIRVSRIRTEVEELSAILDSQTAAVPKAVPASDEGRKKAADMIRRLSGEEVSVSTANESGAGAGDTDDDEEEVDMAAIASDDQDPASEQEDAQPWLDASLGDLDAPFAVIPEGVDINTPEGLAVLQERTALQARRVKAKEARDAFREKNAESDRIRAQQEGVEQARLAKAADLAQREEVLSENEADLQRRQQELAALREEAEREIESRRQAIEQEAARAVEDLSEERRQLEEEQERFGERAKVLDRLSDVFKEDVEKKVEIVRFVSDNMSGLFSVREVPHRFGQVSGMFMDLALARAIQKRVKGSSVGLQDALMSENSEGLPERIFPNKLNMAFHGATVFRKSAEIVHKLATELEVEVSVPSALDEEVDVQALIDACLDEEEKEFVSDVSSWMKSSRTEFFEMTKAVEENAHDFRMARKVESSNMQDVEQLAQANAALKLRLDEAEKELGAVRADLKQAQAQIQARPARPGGAVSEEVQGHVDSGTVAMEINEMFTKEGFSRNRGKSLLEVGQRKVVVGLLDGNAGLPSKKKVMAELEAGSHLPVIVFTNAPPEEQDDISGHLAEFANVAISFQPLAMEDAREFMLEEIRKLDDE
jgi:plasmid stabilization system protein ParE